jgi:hypothetical protein
MKNRISRITCQLAAAGILGSAVSTYAVPVTPSSYSFVPGTKQGSYSYADETSNQLTDGLYGPTRITSQDDAVPYVGWNAELVTIDFTFDELTTFDSVSVSALQAWVGNIVIPDVYLLTSADGLNWTPVATILTPESSQNNSSKRAVTFTDLNLTTEYIQIQLGRNNIGPWMFVDEITFESASNPALGASVVGTNVPEVGSTLALLGIGISSLLMFRRRSS